MPGTLTGPTLETARLLLRPPIEADLDGWAELTADSEVMRFIGAPGPRLVAWRSMAAHAGMWALRGYGNFSVIERSTGRWLGRVGPYYPEGWPAAEVGWSLLRDAWGRGYATEAARASIDWVFDALGWTEVAHVIAPDNIASAAVAARLGSVNRGPTQLPPPHEANRVDLWGQGAAEWRGRNVPATEALPARRDAAPPAAAG